jgi:hypothetical protein
LRAGAGECDDELYEMQVDDDRQEGEVLHDIFGKLKEFQYLQKTIRA